MLSLPCFHKVTQECIYSERFLLGISGLTAAPWPRLSGLTPRQSLPTPGHTFLPATRPV